MIADMLKVQIGVTADAEERLLQWLQEHEVLHVIETQKNVVADNTDAKIDYQLARLQFALEFVERIKKELHIEDKKSIKNMFAGKPAASLLRLEQVLKSLKIDALLNKVYERSDELSDIKSKRQELEDERFIYWPWRALEFAGDDTQKIGNVRHALIKVSLQESLLVKKQLQDIKTLVLHEVRKVVENKQGLIYLEVIVHRSEEKKLDNILAKTNADLVSLDLPTGLTITKHIENIDNQLKDLKTQEKGLLRKAKRFIKLEKQLKFAYDALLHHKERSLTKQNLVRSPLAVIISGWLPKHLFPVFEKKLAEEFESACVEEVELKKNEVPPVMFKNSKTMRPFEAVTDIYGKPKYSELDPSPILALFFLVAFGLALTDAGYGIVMMLMMWAADKFFKLKKSMRKMINLLFYAGLSTLIFGALTGGWFGISLEKLPPSEIRDILLSVKLIDPISQPMTLLVVAFTVGIVQLLFAWGVRGYDHWRQKRYFEVIFDDAAWITMVVLILLWVGSSKGLLSESLTKPFLWALWINTGVLILTQGRSYKNPVLKIAGGVLSLYGLISFLSDTLSYSRLLALGLATGIIALVVNLIGSMVMEMVPVVGWLLAGIVLLFGHIFNLGINALGAFIHSGRLQFVEFFPKFMEGGGRPYKPFGRVSKYVDNPNEFK
jgi:V/A-type H+-transporting ATPase subunit I